ncbi:hypothetical protein KCU73_g14, partial [Aureobasidium melanogenum]
MKLVDDVILILDACNASHLDNLVVESGTKAMLARNKVGQTNQPCMQAAPAFVADGVQLSAVSNDKIYTPTSEADEHEVLIERSSKVFRVKSCLSSGNLNRSPMLQQPDSAESIRAAIDCAFGSGQSGGTRNIHTTEQCYPQTYEFTPYDNLSYFH